MLGRDIQGLEIVPLVLDLGTIDRAEPQAPIRSFNSSMVCVSGCRCPNRGRIPGTVGSKRGPVAVAPAPLATRAWAASSAASICCLSWLKRWPACRLVGLVDRAEAFLGRFEPAALHAQELDPRSLQGRGVAGRLESGQRHRGLIGRVRQEIPPVP